MIYCRMSMLRHLHITETGQKKEKGTRALLVATLDDKKKRHWQKEDE